MSGGLFGLWTWAAAPDQRLREPLFAVLAGVFFGLLLGVCITLLLRTERKKSGVAELAHHDRLVVSRALRTGEPPADPALHPVSRRLAASNLAAARKNRRAAPFVYGALLVLGLLEAWLVSLWFLLLSLWAVFLNVYARIVLSRAETRMAALERALAER